MGGSSSQQRSRRMVPLVLIALFLTATGIIALILSVNAGRVGEPGASEPSASTAPAPAAPAVPPAESATPAAPTTQADPADPSAAPPPAASPVLPAKTWTEDELRTLTDEQLLDVLANDPLWSMHIGGVNADCAAQESAQFETASGDDYTERFDALTMAVHACVISTFDQAVQGAGVTMPEVPLVIYKEGTDDEFDRQQYAWFDDYQVRIVYASSYPSSLYTLDELQPSRVRLSAHEYAHALQLANPNTRAVVRELNRRSIGFDGNLLSHRREMQAECIAMAVVSQSSGPYTASPAIVQAFIDGTADRYMDDFVHGTEKNMTMWAARGLQSGGDLSVCNTYLAPDSEVE